MKEPLLGGVPSNRDEFVASSQVVLDGDLSKERLISLIGLQRGEDSLDYKSFPTKSSPITPGEARMVAVVQ